MFDNHDGTGAVMGTVVANRAEKDTKSAPNTASFH
jgi:hypothetical protein